MNIDWLPICSRSAWVDSRFPRKLNELLTTNTLEKAIAVGIPTPTPALLAISMASIRGFGEG